MIHKALMVSPRDKATVPRENTPITVSSHQVACLEIRFMSAPVLTERPAQRQALDAPPCRAIRVQFSGFERPWGRYLASGCQTV